MVSIVNYVFLDVNSLCLQLYNLKHLY